MGERGTYKVNGIPILAPDYTTGNIFFVDSGHANATNSGGWGGHPHQPFATVDYAIGQCTASNGDIIYVMPGHAETTTAIAADVIGISIIGIGHGRQRPALTATTAASDLIDVTVADVRIKNMRLVGAASGCTSLVSVAAHDFLMEDCVLEQAATPLIGVNVAHNYDRTTIRNCLFLGTAAGPDVAIDFTGSGDSVDYTIEGCTFNYTQSADLDLAGIRSSKIDTGVLISKCRFIGMTLTAIDFNSAATGLVEHCSVVSLNATQQELMDMGNLAGVQNYVSYQAVDGVGIPTTTATA